MLSKMYYSPKGYWKGVTAIKKLASAANVSENTAKDFLKKQAIWQIYLPKPKDIPRPKFDVPIPNEVHQADLLFLPHDKYGRKTYKYALTVVDIASRYKAAEPLTTKEAKEVAAAFSRIYNHGPLKWPKLLQVDPGREFMGVVSQVFAKNNVKIRRGRPEIHRDQGIVERFNRTLAERLFGYQYAQEMKLPEGVRSTEWVRRLPAVVTALNEEETRLIGLKPKDAIKLKNVAAKPALQSKRAVGLKEKKIITEATVRYLYQPVELEGGQHRATDPIWSLDIYKIDRSFTKPDQPIMYYLLDGPKRSFVREELIVVPPDTQNHQMDTYNPAIL